jgi:hypothetical protein
MTAPRRTYVVSIYEDGAPIVVRDVSSNERARLEDLDELPARIRDWEAQAQQREEARV